MRRCMWCDGAIGYASGVVGEGGYAGWCWRLLHDGSSSCLGPRGGHVSPAYRHQPLDLTDRRSLLAWLAS